MYITYRQKLVTKKKIYLYGINNILDFHFYYDTPKKYRIEDGHPNELWYEEYGIQTDFVDNLGHL